MDYLIQSSDTIPVFQSGAVALKTNGLAILNVAVPYLVGVAVALAIIAIVWVAVRMVRGKV